MQQQQQQQQEGSDNYAAAPEMLSFGGSEHEQAEAASPISSRPPAAAAAASISFDELADHVHLQGGGGGGGNRWPRQETLALLKIRSEMDVAFRDATLKAPLWDEVSRTLGELGYVRSAKKCKEKFENVHKYYKRTKEGRQDGNTYRFFTQLEAMQGQGGQQPPPTAVSASLLLPASTSHRHQQEVLMTSGPPAIATTSTTVASGIVQFAGAGTATGTGTGGVMPSGRGGVLQPFAMYSTAAGVGSAAPPVGISDGASSDSDNEVYDDDMMSEEEEEELEDRPASSNPKRKGSGSGSRKAAGGGNKRSRMMDFFEGLMKQVMQKQEAMQQKFLDTIEKREQDRLMREEAWKQHEAARLTLEQQLAAQERAMSASRDAAIVSFLHKITGHTIQLPPQPQPQPHPQPIYTTTSTAVHHVVPVAPPTAMPATALLQQSGQRQVIQPLSNTELIIRQQQQQVSNQMPPPALVPASNNDVIMAVPERQIPPQAAGQESSSSEPASSSSRWPKAEVLALIKLRSSLENRYQEAGSKGPLWEEISAGMQRMGYSRSSKRCKEKWENINKYFKKVKESNKKRPEDAKTCPYFNELDALYQRKKLGSSSSGGTMVHFQQQQQADYMGLGADKKSTPIRTGSTAPGSVVQQASALATQVEPVTETAVRSNDQARSNDGGLSDDNLIGAAQGSNIEEGSKKPEDIMMEQKQLDLEEYNQQKMDIELGDNSTEDEDDEGESKEERKIRYKIDQFQKPSTNKNGGTLSSSFNITMVQ